MKWTSNKPTAEGWYWWRKDETGSAIPREVDLIRGELIIHCGFYVGYKTLVKHSVGQWSSEPISLPI